MPSATLHKPARRCHCTRCSHLRHRLPRRRHPEPLHRSVQRSSSRREGRRTRWWSKRSRRLIAQLEVPSRRLHERSRGSLGQLRSGWGCLGEVSHQQPPEQLMRRQLGRRDWGRATETLGLLVLAFDHHSRHHGPQARRSQDITARGLRMRRAPRAREKRQGTRALDLRSVQNSGGLFRIPADERRAIRTRRGACKS